jgi:hypothetical protein
MPTTTYTLSLARSANGNWSLIPSENLTATLAPMAFPAHLDSVDARDYADAILATARVPAPPVLEWHRYGTTTDGAPAYRASWSVSVQSLSPKGV